MVDESERTTSPNPTASWASDSYENWYVRQFKVTLGEPLQNSDRMSDAEIDSLLQSAVIPKSMRAYYRVAGKHWLNTNHNHLRKLDALEMIDGHLVFMDENQFMGHWAIRTSELTVEDPRVYQGQQTESGYDWFDEKHAFSRFVLSMWKWTLTGSE